MSHDVDDDLRRLFDKSASTIGTISPGFTDTVLTEGARRRRTRRVTAAGGTAATVLLVSAALWQVPDLVDNSSPVQPANPSVVTTVTTPAVDARFAEPADWAASLPRGENVRAAFAVGQTLYAGDVSTAITGAHVTHTSSITVAGPVADGWLALVLTFGNDGAETWNGVIAPDGTFTPFVDQPHAFSPIPPVASPDGTQFATGRDVGDVETGQIVTSFPHPGVWPAAWLDEGIVYSTDMGYKTRMWIWQPGSEPEETFSFEAASTSGGIVVTADGDCAGVGPLDAAPSTYQRICEGRVLSISPQGERVFTETFTVVDVASGEVTTLPVPRFDRPRMSYYNLLILTTFWEDEDHVVMLVPSGNQTTFRFVRCEISTNTCERASDELHGDDISDVPMELSPLD